MQGEPPPNRFFEIDSTGTHKLWSKGREARTLLDQILLTMDPDFNAEEASQGEAIPILTAVEPEDKLTATWGKVKVR